MNRDKGGSKRRPGYRYRLWADMSTSGVEVTIVKDGSPEASGVGKTDWKATTDCDLFRALHIRILVKKVIWERGPEKYLIKNWHILNPTAEDGKDKVQICRERIRRGGKGFSKLGARIKSGGGKKSWLSYHQTQRINSW